jgi:hypothetical protein
MFVFSKWVCKHPAYRLPEKKIKEISCYSLDNNTPQKPAQLVDIDRERNLAKLDENRVKVFKKKRFI